MRTDLRQRFRPVAVHEETAQAAEAYDSLAERYEDLLVENPVLAHSARVSEDLVSSAMSAREFLLEIGCGTGRETLSMAARGKRVVACDPSRVSLEVLKKKASDRGLLHLVETRQLPASRIAELANEFGPHSFDGAYSSFALSYEPDLSTTPRQIWGLLRPRSPFLCSIFNRLCLMELVVFAPFLLPRRGLWRLAGKTTVTVNRSRVTVLSYTPREVKKLFGPLFLLDRVWGIPAIIPPHYLHPLVKLSGLLRPVWEDLDRRLNGSWPFNHLGSHTAYLFRSRA